MVPYHTNPCNKVEALMLPRLAIVVNTGLDHELAMDGIPAPIEIFWNQYILLSMVTQTSTEQWVGANKSCTGLKENVID